MNYLFDVSPLEVPDERRKKQSRKQKKSSAPEAEGHSVMHARRRNESIIGRSEGHYTCADETCGSTQFDILDDWRGEWFIECMLCGTGQYAVAVPGVIETPDNAADFVFSDGRYEGLSIAEVSADDHGPVYLAWAAKSHKREAVRVACQKWIDSSAVQP